MIKRPNLRRDAARTAYAVARIDEIPPGGRLIVELGGRSIGIFNIQGRYYALRNLCPHQQAPLCEGKISGTTLPSRPGEYVFGKAGEIVRCPWHAWEFDITTGRSVFDPRGCRVRSYPVTIQSGFVDNSDTQVETFPITFEDSQIVVHV